MDKIESKCVRCKKWYDKQAELLTKCSTIFDIPIDLDMFERECIKSCPYLGTEIYEICGDNKE
jgi:hypothetical protein